MNEIIENSTVARSNATIVEFMALAEADMIDCVLDFTIMQEQRYMKFWKNWSIIELINGTELRFVYWGTELAKVYDREWTGKFVVEEDYANISAYRCLCDIHMKTIKRKEILYTNGTLDWVERDYTKWNRVNIPILRTGEICSLSLVVFE